MIARLPLYKEKFTTAGKWGFVLAMLMIFSFSVQYRVNIAGLLVHPYLLVLPVAFFFEGLGIRHIPQRVLVCLSLFFVIFSLASLQNESPPSEIFKVGASVATFIYFVHAAKTEKDFKWISIALMLCAFSIGVRGFLAGEEAESLAGRLSGINVLEGIGNKNAQSLFTLPGLFLGAYLLLDALAERRASRIVILTTILFFIIISIFLSANRSGWVGLVIIFVAVLFAGGIKKRTIFISTVLIIITYVAVDRFASDIFERKRRQTVEGYASDVGRQLLMIESFKVGLENPVIGVGFDELHSQMAIRLKVTRLGVKKVDSHFLPGYLFGATGLFSFTCFFLFLFLLPRKENNVFDTMPSVRNARLMMLFFVLLFVVRSLFSREILYSPTFISGLGLVYGYYLFQLRRANSLLRG